MNDAQCLREFAEQRSDRAFRALVDRHLPLVLGVARRITGSNALAEDVAQAVFLLLARKAPALNPNVVLAGWLHRTTRFVAARALEAETRRSRREHTAVAMHSPTDSHEDALWTQIAPDLDAALAQLGEHDRHALLLRFLEQRSWAEVGTALGLGEEAAKKRASRALDKLRLWFERRGRGITTAALLTGLTSEGAASSSAAAALAARVTSAIGTSAGGTSASAVGAASELAEQVWLGWQRARLRWTLMSGAAAVVVMLVVLPTMRAWLESSLGGASASLPATQAGPAAAAGGGGEGAANAGDDPTVASGPGMEVEAGLASGWVMVQGQRVAVRTLHLQVLEEETDRPLPQALATQSMNWSQPPASVGSTKADSNGVVRLYVPERWPGAERMDQYSVWVRATGYAPKTVNWLSTTGNVLAMVGTQQVVHLLPGITLSGTVVDSTEAPIPGVALEVTGSNHRGYTVGVPEQRVQEYSSYGVSMDGAGRERVTTDRRGRFELPSFPRDLRALRIDLRTPDGARWSYLTPQGKWLTAEETIEVSMEELIAGSARLVVPRGYTVAGTVLTSEGEPVRHAVVAEGVQWGNLKILSRADTDYYGHFAFSNRPARQYILAASAPGFATVSKVVQAGPNLGPVEIRLPNAVAVRGQVVDPRGEPLPGVNVSVPDMANPGTGFEWRGTTDGSGRFEWADAPTNEVVLGFASSDYGYRQQSVRAGVDARVVMGVNRPEQVRVTGRVVNSSTREPIPQFTFKVSHDETSVPNDSPSVNGRGVAGHFSCEVSASAVPVGLFPKWMVTVTADGYEPTTSRWFQFQEGDQELDLALEPGGTIHLRLATPDGEPVLAAEVAFAGKRPVYLHGSGSPGSLQRADGDGVFTLDRPLGARTVVILHDSGWALLPAKASADIRDVTLQRWAVVDGVVRSAGSVPGENVVLKDTTWNTGADLMVLRNAWTDREGRFKLSKLPPGEYVVARSPNRKLVMGEPSVFVDQLAITLRAGETQSVELASVGGPVALRLAWPPAWADPQQRPDWAETTVTLAVDVVMPPQPLRGNFVLEDHYAAALRDHARSEAVRAAARQERVYWGSVDARGQVLFPAVPTGRYRLEATLYAPTPAPSKEQALSQPRTVRARAKGLVVIPERPTTSEPGAVFDAGEFPLLPE